MPGKCPVCGAPMAGTTCSYCGFAEKPREPPTVAPYVAPQSAQQVIINNQTLPHVSIVQGISRKSKITALILCILLGYIGAHKFYVGKVGGGLLYLFTGGLFGIGWIIDIISIASGKFKDEFGLPLTQ